MAERSFDAVFTSDCEGKFTYISSAAERIFGFTSEEMVERHFSEFLAESEVPRVLRLFGEAMQGRYTEVMPIEVIKKDGTHAHLEVAHSLILDDGRPVGVQGLIRDMTERRRAEDALRREQRLLRQMLELQERERRLISYEIHDGLTQHVFGAQMLLQGLASRVELLPEDVRESFGQALRLLNCGGEEARALINQLRPPILDESGILAAIDFLIAEQSGSATAEIKFHHDGPFEDLPSALQAIVFRIVQEGLANACRHSQSEKVHVALARNNGAIRVEVRDWGRGFDPDKVEENRFGLEGIRERARLFGGKAAIDTAPGKGTRVSVELPDVDHFPIGGDGRSIE
jgi:PAS domain S-box-containing protein